MRISTYSSVVWFLNAETMERKRNLGGRRHVAALARGLAPIPFGAADPELGSCSEKRAEAVADTDAQINFDAPAVLCKWPSLNNRPISGAIPYLTFGGTLDECIRLFTLKPISQLHLYEIHTAPQEELITAVLSVEQIIALACQRDIL